MAYASYGHYLSPSSGSNYRGIADYLLQGRLKEKPKVSPESIANLPAEASPPIPDASGTVASSMPDASDASADASDA